MTNIQVNEIKTIGCVVCGRDVTRAIFLRGGISVANAPHPNEPGSDEYILVDREFAPLPGSSSTYVFCSRSCFDSLVWGTHADEELGLTPLAS